MRKSFALLTVLIVLLPAAAYCFNGQAVTEGPLSVFIDELDNITEYDQPYTVTVKLTNAGAEAIDVGLAVKDLVDEWRCVGAHERRITVRPGQTPTTTFKIAAGKGALSALYPVHVYATFERGGKTTTVHAIRIFESQFPAEERSQAASMRLPTNLVPANGALPLYLLTTHRLAWQYYDGPLQYTHVAFTGQIPESYATFFINPVTRGSTKQAMQMHPPYRPRAGTVFVEYKVKLPDTGPITLSFANAIRDHGDSEPPSDGVTFRVWADDEQLFSRHTAAKQWQSAEVDLSKYASREILLRLESDPGPERDTTCDSSFWAEPIITAGKRPAEVSQTRKQELRSNASSLARGAAEAAENQFLFKLDDRYNAAVALGANGLIDAAIAFADADRSVVFDGLNIDVLRHSVGRGPSPVVVSDIKVTEHRPGQSATIRHTLAIEGEQFDLTARIFADGVGLRIAVESPNRITDFAVGSADRKAPRIYYGHGYCIVEPQAFRAGYGGHNLSTSHVGFDFDNDLSLLMAVDNPPDYLEVNPDSKTYALHTHMNATMTFVPSRMGAFDCALKYRPMYDKKASPAFGRKAGRFVFDIWGGNYSNIAETMGRMIDYGLTDSLLTVHVWQRWGYDYKLPDIYPPLPSLGSVEDMRKIADLCKVHDIPWGLHDNYIDFYPDAQDYSYDDIAFTPGGRPIKAWLNEGRDAQSYRWRPDRFMPFLQRNLRLIKPGLKPTHYFIDVFTSIGPFDFYDRSGKFHSSLETRKYWGESFAWIRDYLGGDAPQTSEAGHDQLTGYLDGADCQHLRITDAPGEFCLAIKCKTWQRVPWFDAVLHDKFSLHGVGYSSRYQSGRSREEAGIESDDYISAEILEGHALMIDRGAFGQGAVRKYWLAQDFIRSIAEDTIKGVEFVDGDIHHQIITWSCGAKVYVNRGADDWAVEGRMLPQYGYYARNGAVSSCISRIDGVIAERSATPNTLYVNARGFGPDNELLIQPMAEKIDYLGGRNFKLTVKWNVRQPAPKDLSIFTHFLDEKSSRSDGIAFQSDGMPATGTSKWKGTVRTNDNWISRIPRSLGPGTYDITIGLWDPDAGRRYELIGDDDGTTRYKLGKLIVDSSAGNITNIRLEAAKAKPQPEPRRNVARKPVDFGNFETTGAFRYSDNWSDVFDSEPRFRRGLAGQSHVITPLGDLDSFVIRMRTGTPGYIKAIHAVDAKGEKLGDISFTRTDDGISFETRKGQFAYILEHN